MTSRIRLIPRLALFAALIYVLNWSTAYFLNMKVMYFVIFSAGYLWGAPAGMIVGAMGMGLWTFFNPFGPAGLPIAFTQILGAACSGLIGAALRQPLQKTNILTVRVLLLGGAALLCTLLFFVPVSLVDAWLFQPFWPRFITSMGFSLFSLVVNLLIFPLLFPITKMLYERECARLPYLSH